MGSATKVRHNANDGNEGPIPHGREVFRPITPGELLRMLRSRAGLDASALADLAGVSPSVVYNYETGRTRPGLEPLRKLSDALAVALGLDGAGLWEELSRLAVQRAEDLRRARAYAAVAGGPERPAGRRREGSTAPDLPAVG
jgi:transcriptional regulator with XRE-family HTH domain